MKQLAIIGEFDSTFPPHLYTNSAIENSADYLNIDVESTWFSTENLSISDVRSFDGFWIAPGSPYKNLEKTLDLIRFAREENIPLIGTCGGFQHIILEVARNLLNYTDAMHAEYDPYSSNLFVSELVCSLAGKELPIQITPGTKTYTCYSEKKVTEHYYCNFGVNPKYQDLLRSVLTIAGLDDNGEIRIIEFRDHPFFIGTLFVPQQRSTADNPHPLITKFIGEL